VRGDGTRAHEALDIPAPGGTPVLAAFSGTVVKLFTSKAGGLTVYVRSGDIQAYYAHLSGYADGLREGQRVAAGRLECQWQRDQLPAEIRELVLDDQRLRNDICWSVFDC
jgi:hypothetical protein